MSLLKTIRAQLGLSVTPANNFTLDASADNGTMKLARGNAGATTQDIMTVDAAGKPNFPQLPFSIVTGASNKGHITLPNGLLVNWGVVVVSTVAANTWAANTDTLSRPFANGMIGAMVSSRNADMLSFQSQLFSVRESGLTHVTVQALTTTSALSNMAAYYLCWGV